MSEYVLFTDSATDFAADKVEELGIELLSLSFSLDGKTYQDRPDHRDMNPADFYAQLRAGGTSSTSQVTTMEFVDAFRPFVEAGKDILYLGFSSGLSGTLDSAQLAAQDLTEEFPGRKAGGGGHAGGQPWAGPFGVLCRTA